MRFDRRFQGRRLPAGTYELRLRSPGIPTRRLTVVISNSARPSPDEIATARKRNVCRAGQVLGATSFESGVAAGEPGLAAPGAKGGAQDERVESAGAAQPAGFEAEPDEGSGFGFRAFSPGRLAEEVPQSPLGSVLLALAVLLLGVALLPRVAIPDPRLGRLLVAKRIEVAAVGASLFLGVLLVIGLG